MALRRNDNSAKWIYFAVHPGMDLKMNPIAIQKNVDGPSLVESVGVDGRYLGAVRPFPGFANATVHGVPTPSGTTTVTSLSAVQFAKYVSIQKGNSNHVISGIVYVANNSAGTNAAVYFAYRDSETGTSDVRQLEDFQIWDDFKISSLIDYDFTSMGRYIYFSASASTSTTVTSVSGKEAPYNKAYFWDFKVNTWDAFVTGFSQRFMSILPDRILGVLVNENSVDATQLSSTSAYQTTQDAAGTYQLPTGNYTFGAMLMSRKHNLRSKLRLQMKNPIGSPASLKYRIFRTALLEATRQIANSVGANPAVAHAWGLSHWDGVRLYRTVVDDLNDQIGASAINYSAVNPLHIQEAYFERFQDGALLDDEQFDVFFGTDAGDDTYMMDSALTQQEQYDPVLDDFGPAPRMKRIVAYDGMLVGVTDIREPSSPTKQWIETDRYPESFAWSIVTRNPPEPENFPVDHIYPLEDPAERILSLETAGDYLFGISNSAIYRMVRSGAQLAINRLQHRIGGVSRYGQIGVGNSLFVVTRSGLKEVDGNTGEIRSVSALDRLIFDEAQWGPSLGSVKMGYDAYAGCLILLNTTRQEAVILWEATGAITKIENCPWAYLTSGPDVLSNGQTRAYFVTQAGQVHCIDSNRLMGKRTMCGTESGETVNGTFTSGTTTTSMRDSTATFPVGCVGFLIHILSGAQAGQSGTIATRVSATELTLNAALAGAPAVGDRYSIAPIIIRLVFPHLTGDDGAIDPFVAKQPTYMSLSFSDLGGETQPADVNGKVIMGYKRGSATLGSSEVALSGIPDLCVAHVNARDTRPFPYVEFKGSNIDFQLQALKVAGILTGSEAQSAQG